VCFLGHQKLWHKNQHPDHFFHGNSNYVRFTGIFEWAFNIQI
jgi:hypothetical protein